MGERKFIIYDYADRPVSVVIPDKDIHHISITVLSGDETGVVYFRDGSDVAFDASDCRMHDYFDCSYSVFGKDIDKWFSFRPSGRGTAADERQRMLCLGGEDQPEPPSEEMLSMERLTKKDSQGYYIEDISVPYDEKRRGPAVDRLGAYEDFFCEHYADCYRRITDWLMADARGRLVELPHGRATWIKMISVERDRQDQKWGHPQKNTYCEWSSILAEEVGELAKELNELNFGRGNQGRMELEAVQVAAVALAILEQSGVAQEVTMRAAAALGRLARQEAETVEEGKERLL